MRNLLGLILILALFFVSVRSPKIALSQQPNPSLDPNFNIQVRGWDPVGGDKNLIDISGPTDRNAPQFGTLLKGCNPRITNLYQVHGNDGLWGATAVGLATVRGDPVFVPKSGYQITDGDAQVIYADENSVTLTYFDRDDIVNEEGAGYTVYITNINTDPGILGLYNQANPERSQLPHVWAYQQIGTAQGNEVIVAIRDSGSFLDPRSKKDWWQSCTKGTPAFPPKLATVSKTSAASPKDLLQRNGALSRFPEESEQACRKEEFGGDVRSSTYHPAKGPDEPEMKDGSGVNLGRGVKGTHCGVTRSEPITLHEETDYNLPTPLTCKTVRWSGTLKISDEDTKKFVIPFAKEIADHWAGRSDEHYLKPELDELLTIDPSKFYDAAGRIINQAGYDAWKKLYDLFYGTTGTLMPPYTGVLKRLESRLYQDQLKCSFINYVKKKGGVSAYNGFVLDPLNFLGLKVGGTKLTDIPCPPSALGNTDIKANEAWDNKWRILWSKIGLFPDERSVGELKFEVCEDKEYNLLVGYPNVFRLGLATNELFKIYTAKDKRDSYYLANRDVTNLMQPLDKNSALAEGKGADTPRFAEKIENPKNLIASTVLGLKNEIAKRLSPISNLISSITNFFQSLRKNVPVLAQGGPQCPNFSVTVNSYNPTTGDYCIFIKHDAPGPIGDVLVNPQTGGIHYENIGPNGATLCTGYEGADQFLPKEPGVDPATIQTCLDLKPFGNEESPNFCEQRRVCFNGTGNPPPPGPQACIETGDCHVDCKICKIAQKNPSDVTIWPSAFQKNRVVLGGRTDGDKVISDDPATQVKYTFHIPVWNPGDPLPGGCSESGGKITCIKEHDRVVDVYNKVPFLASIWKEAAGATTGFLNSFKPKELKGSGIQGNVTGCTDQTFMTLDTNGSFATNPAYSEVTYSFNQITGNNEVEVTLVNPKSGDKKKVTFYRIGGVCNADKWFSQRVLNPLKIQ